MLQADIEYKFSKRGIREVVLADIDLELNSTLLETITNKIEEYRKKEYGYDSKNRRIKELEVDSRDIAIEVMVATITITTSMSPIQTVVAKLIPHLGLYILDGIKVAAEVLAVCDGTTYELGKTEDNLLMVIPKYSVSDEVEQFIANTKYLPPMICKPRDWVSNGEGGNLTENKSVILGDNHHWEEQRLDVINLLQGVAWELNEDMLEFVEKPKKVLDTSEKARNFKQLSEESEEVYQDLLDQGNTFYFPWRRCFRGRAYSQGYHVNPQGNEYRKSIINFKTKTLITDEIIL